MSVRSCVGARHGGRGHARAALWLRAFAPLALVAVAVPAVAGYAAYSLTRVKRVDVRPLPSSLGCEYEEVAFPSRVDGLRLRGWFLPARPAEAARSVILLHGHERHRADPTIGILDLAAMLVDRGYNVLAFDMRGHGESAGDFKSFGFFETRDLLGAVDYLERRGGAGQWIGVVGFSMGAATAILAAADEPRIRAVVADSCFADFRELLEEALPRYSGLPSPLTPAILLMSRLLLGVDVEALRPERQVGRLSPRPLLVIHGEADDTVPLAHARRLAAACPAASLWVVAAANHSRAFKAQPEEYLRRIEETFARALPQPVP